VIRSLVVSRARNNGRLWLHLEFLQHKKDTFSLFPLDSLLLLYPRIFAITSSTLTVWRFRGILEVHSRVQTVTTYYRAKSRSRTYTKMKQIILISLTPLLILGACSPSAMPTVIVSTSTKDRLTVIPSSTHRSIPPTTTPKPTLTGCVEATYLNIRSGPGTQYSTTGALAYGVCVSIEGRDQDTNWAWINSEGKTGWVLLHYLSITGNLNQLPVIANYSIATRTLAQYSSPPVQSLMMQCRDTINYSGSNVTCMINRAYCSYMPDVNQSPTFCNDAPYPSHGFTLVVWGNDWSDYDGQCLVVKGIVTIYNDKPQIEAESRSQVSNCP